MALRSRTAARFSEPSTGRRLGRRFFDRPTILVARALLGAVLRVRGRAVRIVEVEAYVSNDPASHAFRGPTPRNRSMFGVPGTLYVYRIHQVVCANLVTRCGQAVLLRAGEPLTPDLTNTSGPGRLCRALGIERPDDGVDVSSDASIWMERGNGDSLRVVTGPRIGIRRGRDRRLRFALADSPWVSRPKPPGVRPPTSTSPTRSRAGGARPRTRTRRRRSSDGGRSAGRTAGR